MLPRPDRWMPRDALVLPSLRFGDATSDRVDHGTGASITSLTSLIAAMWIYPTTQTQNRRLWAKGTAGNGKATAWLTGDPNDLEWVVNRATTTATAQTSVSFPTGKWLFICWAYDETDGPRVFWGTHFDLAVEAAYVTRTVGSGASVADTGSGLFVGNRSAAGSAIQGSIAAFEYHKTPGTTGLAEARRLHRMLRVPGCALQTLYGSREGTQIDRTGNGNHGTVTGATRAGAQPFPLVGLLNPGLDPIVIGKAPAVASIVAPRTYPLGIRRGLNRRIQRAS